MLVIVICLFRGGRGINKFLILFGLIFKKVLLFVNFNNLFFSVKIK